MKRSSNWKNRALQSFLSSWRRPCVSRTANGKSFVPETGVQPNPPFQKWKFCAIKIPSLQYPETALYRAVFLFNIDRRRRLCKNRAMTSAEIQEKILETLRGLPYTADDTIAIVIVRSNRKWVVSAEPVAAANDLRKLAIQVWERFVNGPDNG